jgi:hypothetical protein
MTPHTPHTPHTPPTSAPTGPTFPVAVLRLWGLLEGDSRPLNGVPESVTDTLSDTGARCVDCWGRLPFGLGRVSVRCGACQNRADDEIRQRIADACADDGGHLPDPWPHFDAEPWAD